MKTKIVRPALSRWEEDWLALMPKKMSEMPDNARYAMIPYARNSARMKEAMRHCFGNARPPKETDKNIKIMRAAARRTGLAQLILDAAGADGIYDQEEVNEILHRALGLLGLSQAERKNEVFPYLPVPRIACKPYGPER